MNDEVAGTFSVDWIFRILFTKLPVVCKDCFVGDAWDAVFVTRFPRQPQAVENLEQSTEQPLSTN